MEETVREINERNNRKQISYIQCPRTKPKGREGEDIYMEFVEGLCNEVCNLNLNVKDEITKVIRLGKKQTEGDTGDTEQKPRPLKVVIKDTKKDGIVQMTREREEGRKLLEQARTKQINDEGKLLYRERFKPRRDEE